MRPEFQQLLLQRLRNKDDQAVFTIVRRTGNKPANDLTGGDLLTRARRMQTVWREVCGHEPAVVILAFSHGELFLTSLIAGLLSGVTIVPVALPRPGAGSDRLRHIVQDCGATAVFCDADQTDNLHRTLTQGSVVDSPCAVAGLDEHGAVASVKKTVRIKDGTAPGDTSGPALIQYTSGSTRMPKGIRIFAEQIMANAELARDPFRFGEHTRFVNWLPHYHDMGLMGGILYPLLLGGYSVQMSPLDMIRKPGFWLKCISDFKATISGGPAFAFAHCMAHVSDKECEGLDLSSLTTFFCGAEPVPADLLPKFRQRFSRCGLPSNAVFSCYGLAEFTLFAAGANELETPPENEENTQPCQLTPDTKAGLGIFNPESGKPVADGTRGEIWLSGDSMGRGYVNLPEESAATFDVQANTASGAGSDGPWLRTGDLGVLIGDWLYITGRIKDIIIANGMKIASTELEWLASGLHDALNPSAAAAFMTNPGVSGHAVLLIELKSAKAKIDNPELLKQVIANAVAGEWSIKLDDIQFIPRGKLERTSSGKIRRHSIAAAWRAAHSKHQAETAQERNMQEQSIPASSTTARSVKVGL